MAATTFSRSHKLFLSAISVLILSGLVFFLRQTQASDTPAARDAKRISDLAQIQSELETYFNKCGYYPGGVQEYSACSLWVPANTWASMDLALRYSKIGITSVPNDPSPGVNYFYGGQMGGKGYVIGAVLEDHANPALAQSAQGVVDGVNCASNVYCVQVAK